MNNIKIDIVSDIACPWCAIGYARLEQAMNSLAAEFTFSIEWHAFELNPDPSSADEPILQALSRKYGRSVAEMEAAQSNMMEIATELGLNFSQLQKRYTRNTFDAHRLVKWASEQGLQTEMKKSLFNAYFGHAENVSDIEVLVRCAESAGLDGNQARVVISSDLFTDIVREDEASWQQAGISSVPAFIINQKYLISGAQEPDTFIQALHRIASEPDQIA